MKKIATLLLAIFSSVFSFAQNYEFTYLALDQWADVNTMMTGRAYIKNLTSSSVNMKVKRIEHSVVANTVNYFCWDVCYGPSTDISVNALTVAAGDTITDFYADYEPSGNAGTSHIQYCFFNQADQNDSICVNAYFYASPTGVETLMYADANTLSSAYPNPADGSTKINYTLRNEARSAKIELHNILGAKVKTIDLKEKFAAVEIQLSGLESGVYFYSLIVDHKTIASKKLVVAK
ncbi:MAG: T9SS type A sorting domain-containing protein [Bacteroidia bacterium]